MAEGVQNIYTQTRLPEWIQPYYDRLATESQAMALEPYQTYGGTRLADFTAPETKAFEGITALGTSAGPTQQRSATYALGQAQNQALEGPMMAAGRDWSEYMDPYTKNVTDVAVRKALQVGDIQRSELGSRAAQAGAFGGYRHGLGEIAIDRDVRQEISDMQVKGLESAFNRGIGLFEGDRAAQAQGIQTLAGIGMQQGALGAQEQAMLMERLKAMQGVGEQQRAMEQTSMDMGYQDFINQRDYPRDQMSWFGSILGGFPNQSDTSEQSTTYAPQPSLWQTAAGTAMGGLGAYQAMAGGGLVSLGMFNAMRDYIRGR